MMAGARKTVKTVAPRAEASVKAQPISSAPADVIETPAAPITVSIEVTPHLSVVEVSSSLTDLQEYVRKSAEESLEKTRAAYDRFRTSAEQATASLETSYAAASEGLNALQAKTLEAFRLNANAQFELVKALVSASSLTEAFQLHNEHARKQFETLSTQVKDISSLAQKVASQSAEPLKTTLTKAFVA
jgi:phasin